MIIKIELKEFVLIFNAKIELFAYFVITHMDLLLEALWINNQSPTKNSK